MVKNPYTSKSQSADSILEGFAREAEATEDLQVTGSWILVLDLVWTQSSHIAWLVPGKASCDVAIDFSVKGRQISVPETEDQKSLLQLET